MSTELNPEPAETSPYEQGFFTWTQEQAQLLRERDFANLDIDHLIEESEGMGRSERRQLISRPEVLLVHLLKWDYQPALRGCSWELTVIEHRQAVARQPRLKHHLPALFVDAYDDATFSAMHETGLQQETFPTTSPYPLEQVLNETWLPGAG